MVLCILFCVYACSDVSKNEKQESGISGKTERDSFTQQLSCARHLQDPDHPKPMALMMRLMADHLDSMKAQILRGEKLDPVHYPFLRFYLAEPTDSTVLEMKFYENSRLFQQAYHALFTHPDEQVKYFNFVVGKCINCHESYCNGPLKRIRKSYIVN